MKASTINYLVNKAVENNKNAGQIVEDFIQQEKNIRYGIQKIQNTIQKLKDEYNIAIDKLQKDIQIIQSTCPHIESVFEGDPSGNNDSHIYCSWCGKEV